MRDETGRRGCRGACGCRGGGKAPTGEVNLLRDEVKRERRSAHRAPEDGANLLQLLGVASDERDDRARRHLDRPQRKQ